MKEMFITDRCKVRKTIVSISQKILPLPDEILSQETEEERWATKLNSNLDEYLLAIEADERILLFEQIDMLITKFKEPITAL